MVARGDEEFGSTFEESTVVWAQITMLELIILLVTNQLIGGLYLRDNGVENIKGQKQESRGKNLCLSNMLVLCLMTELTYLGHKCSKSIPSKQRNNEAKAISLIL